MLKLVPQIIASRIDFCSAFLNYFPVCTNLEKLVLKLDYFLSYESGIAGISPHRACCF